MEQTPFPRREDDVAPADPRFGQADDLNTDERLAVESDYPTMPRARVASLNGSAEASPRQRLTGGVTRSADVLMSWVKREPAIALGAALALGFAIGFVLRRSAFLSARELSA